MNIFVICPVRDAVAEVISALSRYSTNLEMEGHTVYQPQHDTHQIDPIGVRICGKNRRAIMRADEVHIWFDPDSRGSLFDLGVAFGAGKKMVLANPEKVIPTSEKSFANVVLYMTGHLSYEDVVPGTPAPRKIELTDEEWDLFDRDLVRNEDLGESALPGCCGNISDLRDVILDIAGHGGLLTGKLAEELSMRWESVVSDHFDDSAWTILRKFVTQAGLNWPERAI